MRPWLLVALVTLGCTRRHATPPPPPSALARWSFPDRPFTATGRGYALEDGATLWLGPSGRRLLQRRNGTSYEEATTLLPERATGMVREGARFAFLGESGTTWISAGPLGTVVARRPSPTPMVATSTGKSAFVGVDAKGRLLRSVDRGAHWSAVQGSFDGVFDLALDGSGNGLAAAAPQRAFVSHDDGATWSLRDTPSVGVLGVTTDEGARLLWKGDHLAVLAHDALVATEPAIVTLDPPTPPLVGAMTAQAMGLAGGRVWAWGTSPAGFGAFATAPLGGPFETPFALPEACLPAKVVARGDDPLHVLCGGKLFRRDERGWLEVVDEGYARSDKAWTGPAGWLLTQGTATRVRLPDSKKFVVFTTAWPELEVLDAVAADDGKVLLVGRKADRDVVLQSTTTSTSASQLFELEGRAKTARLFLGNDSLRVITIHDGFARVRTVRGSVTTTRDLPKIEDVAFAGERGLALGDGAWETADGGETWTRVGAPRGPVTCQAGGCVVGTAVRVGWDLPRAKRLERLEPLAPPPKPPPAIPTQPAARCRSVGASSALAAPDRTQLDRHGLDWAFAWIDASNRAVLSTSSHGVTQETELFAAPSPPPHRRARVHVEQLAAALLTHDYTPGKHTLEPVDVEVAWYAPKLSKVVRASLPKLGTFFVPNGASPLALRAQGDDLVVARRFEEETLVHPDGTSTKPPFPSGEAIGKHHVTYDSTSFGACLRWDGQLTRIWRLLSASQDPRFALTGGLLAGDVEVEGLRKIVAFPLAEPTPDPPNPLTIELEPLLAKGLFGAPCDPPGLLAPRVSLLLREPRPRIELVDGAPVVADEVTLHVLGDGKACVGAWYAFGGEQRMILPASDRAHATVFSKGSATTWACD